MVTADVPASRMRILILGLLVSLIGAGLSVYSTLHHLEVKRAGSTNYACNINASFSCDDIARSPYSEVLGIPMGVWGLGFFLAVAAILLLGHFFKQNERESLQTFAFMTFTATIASAVLAFISIGLVGKYCIVCFAIYACSLALLALVLTHWRYIPKPFDSKSLTNGGFSAALVVVIIVSAYKFLLPSQPKPPDLAEIQEMMKQEAAQQANLPKRQIPINKNAYSGFGEDFRKGSDSAKVIIVEFADFQCPACGMAAKAISEVFKGEDPNLIQVVFKNYPLDKACNRSVDGQIHQYACTVAKLARCAGEVGKFWEYHDKAFGNQTSMTNETAKAWAKGVGLSDANIEHCLASKDIQAKIDDDVTLGNNVGVKATPTIFINGVQYSGGLDADSIRLYVERALK